MERIIEFLLRIKIYFDGREDPIDVDWEW